MNIEQKKEIIKKEIKNLLSDKKAREGIDILKELNYGKEDDELIMEVLRTMAEEYDLYITKHGRYMNFTDSDLATHMYKGIFQSIKDGSYGFVSVANLESDIFIPEVYKNSALNGDMVLVNVVKDKDLKHNYQGEIVKIIKRNPKSLIAEVVIIKNIPYCILRNSKDKSKIRLEGDGIKDLVDGDIIKIKITDNSSKTPVASMLKHVAHKNDPDGDILAVLAENDFNVEFPKEVLDELESIPNEVSEKDLKGRVDLREEEIFTIDGDDTKDIDDAISLKELPNGNYSLGVHIADVSYYVKENTPLDLEARNRGTSVYVADRVVPMLPHKLSNGICSLNPGVDRLAISCVAEISKDGKIVDFNLFESVIKSRIQMTYNKVNQILEENVVPEGYEEFAPTLRKMYELSKIIRAYKIRKGYVDFETEEAKIVVDENGQVIDIKKRYRGAGENLIEDFMIVANECVATWFSNMDLPTIYRVHGEVNIDRLRKFVSTLSLLGINIKENLNNVNQHTIQRILDKIKDLDVYIVLSTLIISCMDKAKYQTINIGHFALAIRNYLHFTSPIRRYPDTTVHRLLRAYLFSKKGVTEEIVNHFESILDEIALHSSEREIASDKCERVVNDMKMAEYMQSHIGEEFEGIVSGVKSYGMYVLLPDKLIEGMIRVESLDGNFIYNENTECLVETSTNLIYGIGTKLKIKVLSAEPSLGRIDFILEKGDMCEKGKEEKVKKRY